MRQASDLSPAAQSQQPFDHLPPFGLIDDENISSVVRVSHICTDDMFAVCFAALIQQIRA